MRKLAVLAAAAAALLFAQDAAAAGDAAKGEKVFKKCQACHSVDEGQQKVGPSLHGVIGRQAGTVDGYTKYVGLKGADFVWDEALLDAYLADPKAFITEHTDNKRSSMAFKLSKDAERADVIAYLKSLQ
jgi:cytochrome c